jgi:cob(I)alamin adenosyltransferase
VREKKVDQLDEAALDARHAEKMRRKKAARDKILATKTIEKGLVIVHTGKGKGKSTAAMGMVFRALGHGFRIGVVQFVKGKWETGERDILRRFPEQVTMKAMGEGFTWETQDRQRDIAAARAAWDSAREMISDPEYRMVLLDELNIVLRYGYLPVEEIVETIGEQAGGYPCHRHRAQRSGRADRDRRSRHRHDHDQAPVPRRCEGAGRNRVLNARWPSHGRRDRERDELNTQRPGEGLKAIPVRPTQIGGQVRCCLPDSRRGCGASVPPGYALPDDPQPGGRT